MVASLSVALNCVGNQNGNKLTDPKSKCEQLQPRDIIILVEA